MPDGQCRSGNANFIKEENSYMVLFLVLCRTAGVTKCQKHDIIVVFGIGKNVAIPSV